nr:reverse transcriptase domain-containing protein [Tanacetum cinerariifolium]
MMSALRRSDNENMLSLTNMILRSILTDLQETLKRRWRYLVPTESHIHNCMLIPNYQDIKYQDFRYSDELSKLGRYEHVSPMSLEHKIVMANPNPEDPNVPNEDVPEEDPYHLLDYDKEEDSEMDIKEEEPEEDPAEGADVELEAEEPDGAPKATIRTGSQRPFAVRDFPMGFYEAGESSTARDPQFVGGLAPWALSGVEETLGKVVERLKVLESEENATLRKKLAEKELLLDLNHMDRDRAEKRLSKSIWIMPPKSMSKVRMREIICDQFATSMNEFMSNMNNGAGGSGGASSSGEAGGSGGTGRNADGTGVRDARPTVHELTGCTYATFIKCNPLPFNGTKGAVGLCQWFEKLESAFQISECKEKDRVKFAMATLRGRALTWWNGRT